MMGLRLPRLQAPVCQLCEFISARRLSPFSALNPKQSRRQYPAAKNIKARSTNGSSHTVLSSLRTKGSPIAQQDGPPARPPAGLTGKDRVDEDMQEARTVHQKLLSSTKIPPETEILTMLSYLEVITDSLIGPAPEKTHDVEGSPASVLLSINKSLPKRQYTKASKISPDVQKYVDELSRMTYEIIEFPTVFITPEVLRQYVDIQAKLRKPSSIPPVFELYANKPQPIKGSGTIRYSLSSPNKTTSAIPPAIADRALATAIDTKDFDAATAIVETSYGKKAFRLNKILRKSLLPATAALGTPIAAYAIASKLTEYENVMDPQVSTNLTFAAIMAYVGFSSIIGLVAVTTANDHMDRVTWATGTPLRNRWLREEERAAMDKIAGAWGFRESWRKGEEEGPEWDTLRDWIGFRGMVLDQASLLDGME